MLPDTIPKYLGLYNSEHPEESRAAALRYHLMVQWKYGSFVSGDGACAGCGESSVFAWLQLLLKSLMRPIFHRKADWLENKADLLKENGLKNLNLLKEKDEISYNIFKTTFIP